MAQYGSRANEFTEDCVPETNEQSNLGRVGRRWGIIRARDVIVDTLTFLNLTLNTLTVSTSALFSYLAGGGVRFLTVDNAGVVSASGGFAIPLDVASGGTGTTTIFTTGSVVFASAAGAYAQNNSQFFWDNTKFVLQLSGGALGGNFTQGISFGSGSGVGVDPTTFPADTVQGRAKDTDGAGTTGWAMWDELGNRYTLGQNSSLPAYTVLTPGGVEAGMFFGDPTRLGTLTNHPLHLLVNNTIFFTLERVGPNAILGTDTTIGTNAAGLLYIDSGTPPTTAPADKVGHWTADRNGAGTASPFVRTEDSGINERPLAVLVQAFDTTERTTVATSTTTLSTLAVNIPPSDAFIVTGLVRRTTGHASAVFLGLKINGVQIITDFAVTTTNNAAEFGTFAFGAHQTMFGQGRDTNYTQGAGLQAATGTSGGTITGYGSGAWAAQLPTAAITEIIISGHVTNALNTLAVKDITVYRVART